MSKLVNFNVTCGELEIIEDIKAISYGEIYSLVDQPGNRDINTDVTEKTRSFILYLREKKFIEKLIIHDREPALSEIGTKTANGRECMIKRKF